jgi:prevent-host-death family protein
VLQYELYGLASKAGGGEMGETKVIGASEARDVFSDLVSRVAYAHERIVIERRQKPVAALISMEELELFERLLEEHEDRLDAAEADRVLADEADEVVPFERST